MQISMNQRHISSAPADDWAGSLSCLVFRGCVCGCARQCNPARQFSQPGRVPWGWDRMEGTGRKRITQHPGVFTRGLNGDGGGGGGGGGRRAAAAAETVCTRSRQRVQQSGRANTDLWGPVTDAGSTQQQRRRCCVCTAAPLAG